MQSEDLFKIPAITSKNKLFRPKIFDTIRRD